VRSAVSPDRNRTFTLKDSVIAEQRPERCQRLRSDCVDATTRHQHQDCDAAHPPATPLENATVQILTHVKPHD
jgi:hypothetical protein